MGPNQSWIDEFISLLSTDSTTFAVSVSAWRADFFFVRHHLSRSIRIAITGFVLEERSWHAVNCSVYGVHLNICELVLEHLLCLCFILCNA